jgi:hypothetical protein
MVEASTEEALQDAVIQITAEHSVSFLSDPPRAVPPADVEHEGQLLHKTPGATVFKRANECHHEIILESEDDLFALARLLIIERSTRRLDYVTLTSVLGHAKRQLDEGDAEWAGVLARSEKKGWMKRVRTTDK